MDKEHFGDPWDGRGCKLVPCVSSGQTLSSSAGLQQPNKSLGHRQGGSITVLFNVSIDNLDDGMNGSLGKLAMIPNWGEQSMCYRAGLLCRGTWTSPEEGLCDGRGWSTGCTRGGGGHWAGSTWGRGGEGEIFLLSATAWWEGAEKMEPNSSQG